VLKGLLGSASVAGPTMTSLAENFGLEPLITKPLAIISDARIGSRIDKSAITERLLSISGEDQMTVARKYLAAWTGQLMTRFMILTNDLLSMNDGSGALPGRFLVLLMIKSFYGKEDLKLTRKLLGELPGILNWSLEGYLRLRKRGHFVQPASSREAVDEIELLAAPVKAFIRDRCKIGTGKEVEHDKLWTAWRAWADGEGRDAGTKAWFGRNLRSAAPGVANKKPGKRGDRRHIYSGITLRGSAKVQAFLAASITNRKK
jgi:putative DNA primase/helicase